MIAIIIISVFGVLGYAEVSASSHSVLFWRRIPHDYLVYVLTYIDSGS